MPVDVKHNLQSFGSTASAEVAWDRFTHSASHTVIINYITIKECTQVNGDLIGHAFSPT